MSTQNIALSIAVLVTMNPLAVIGVAVAVVVHAAAELSAVANGLRAGHVQVKDVRLRPRVEMSGSPGLVHQG